LENILQDKICVVTGAGSGIGASIALNFAANGGIVYANARREEVISDLKMRSEFSDRIVPLIFDVTDAAAARAALLRVRKEQGRLDVLVNNAAKITYEPMGMVTRKLLEELFETNVYAVFEMAQSAARIMASSGGGSIVNIASIVGEKGAAGQAAYSATKGAVIALTKSAAKELGPAGVRVNAIAPGMVRTERFEKEMRERFPESEAGILLGRLAEPEEISELVAFLASEKASYITGQIIEIDGGMLL
jgi:3-oxoacyl-[acyl-carrier protein] reductase